MKNVKRMVAAGTMMMTMMFGATLVNAGIIIAREKPATTGCSESPTTDLAGIIIAGIIIAKTGIIIARDSRGTCSTTSPTTNGIIIA